MGINQNLGNPKSASKTWAQVGLGVLLIAQFGLALGWIVTDQTPSFWDPASHGRAALKSGHAIWRDVPPVRGRLLPDRLREEAIAHPVLARFALGPVAGPMNWAEAFYRHPFYPSLPFVVTGLALPLTGDEPDALALSMGTLWLLLAILATYLLATRSFGEIPDNKSLIIANRSNDIIVR